MARLEIEVKELVKITEPFLRLKAKGTGEDLGPLLNADEAGRLVLRLGKETTISLVSVGSLLGTFTAKGIPFPCKADLKDKKIEVTLT